MIKWLLYHVCVELVANLEWLIQLEYGYVKPESKDQHLAAFWQNKPHQPKSLACLVIGLCYIRRLVSLAEY